MAFASCLVVLAACGSEPAPNDDAGAPIPVANNGAEAPMPDLNTMAPQMPDMGEPPTPTAPPSQGNGPRERFVVCPGNPRCPPAGSKPDTR